MKRVPDINRRAFVSGALALGLLGGCQTSVSTSPRRRPTGVPRLKLGILSDIHVTEWGMENYLPTIAYDVQTFVRALRHFRDQGVDGVVIAGDLADYGLIAEMEAVARAWELVFPGNRLPNGREVVKLFVTGNHDWEGFRYRDYGARHFPNPDDLRRAVLQYNLKEAWERIWKEPYLPVWTKQVRGYEFVGAHWEGFTCQDGEAVSFAGAPEAIRAAGRRSDPSRPFFFIQHPQPRGTNYGLHGWGHDHGEVTAALSEFPNAVAISGHSHYPLTDDRALWQGAFTSLQMSSLRYSAAFCEDLGPTTMEDAKSTGPDAAQLDARKLLPRAMTTDGRHGSVLTVFDDCISITRRDFLADEPLGEDWVVPFPPKDEKPYDYASQARREAAPTFGPEARLSIVADRRADRAGNGHDVVVVRFPSVMAEGSPRAPRFEVCASVNGMVRSRKFVSALGFNRAVNRQPRLTECVFDIDELGRNREIEFAVTPVAAFGTRGCPLRGLYP